MEFDGPAFRDYIESVHGGLKLGQAIKKHQIPIKSRTAIYQRFERHVRKNVEEMKQQQCK